jgi:hypothetical protein
LRRPDDSVIASATIGTGGGSIPIQELITAGTYGVVVDPTGANTGAVTVTLDKGPLDVTGPIVPGGSAVPVTISAADQNARLSFSGSNGQRMSVSSSSSTISLANLSILRPDGTSNGATTIASGSGFLDTKTLDGATGTYTIFLDPIGTRTGSVTLRLFSVPADASGSIVAGGSAQTVTLGTPGQNGTLSFAGVRDQRVSLKVSGSTFVGSPSCCAGAKVSIKNPDGSPLVAPQGVGTAGLFIDTSKLLVDGTYQILVDPQDAATGTITLQLYDVPADVSGSVTIGGPSVTQTMSVPGQGGVIAFSGTGGQQLSLDLTGVTIGTACCSSAKVSVRDDLGAPVLAPTFFGTVGTTVNFAVTRSAPHTITIDPQGDATGSATGTLRLSSGIAAVAWPNVSLGSQQ